MVMDGTKMSAPEERYPNFPGAPSGWSKWPKFRQEKELLKHPEWLVPLNDALASRNTQVDPATLPQVPAPSSPAPTSQTPPPSLPKIGGAVDEITDIRQWNENVDGISAERLRNCITYQLDYKKSKFYRDALTPGFLRRVLRNKGVTGARLIHEDTPPGWTQPDPHPLMKIYYVMEDGKEVEKRKFRRYRTPEEKQELLKHAFTSRGVLIDYFIPRLVDKDCPDCKGTGYREELAYPESKRYSFIKKKVICDCITRIPSSDDPA